MNYMKSVKNILATLSLSLLGATTAFALDLDAAKSQGLVGEVNSGYIAAVKSSAEVNALVEDINNQRREYYKKIAMKNGVSLPAVEVRAGQKAIQKTPAGGLINTGEGWEEK